VSADILTASRPHEDPGHAFRLLRHLHLAEVLWGRETATPIAALDAWSRVPRLRFLRILLQLEREGAVVLQRVTGAVQLATSASKALRASDCRF
jgi:hypothetical protein